MLRFILLAIALSHLALPANADTRVPQSRAEISLGFAPLVRQVTPAVVNIYAKRVVAERVSPFRNDPFFGNLFRDFGETRPRVQNSLGSGVILSAEGLVVSNYHVVGQATDIRVVLSDRREFGAQVVLADESADLAILQLQGAGALPFLPLRNSDTVEVGELALAIGNPFGVGQTVSSGIISGLARSGVMPGSNGRGYFIQTDAAINPGNSGGALIDVNGALIGVNTSILTRSGGSNGIGFAIPANLVAEFMRQAKAGQSRFMRPWAGLQGQAVDADIAASMGADVPEGVLIVDLHPQSPFAMAGFAVGDIVTAVDGQPVNTPPEMMFRMSVAGLGQGADITRLRDGALRTITVTMATAPETPARDSRRLGDASALPGLVVETINPGVIAEFGLPLHASGALVAQPGPLGARLGVQPGDIVVQANGQAVANSASLAQVLAQRGAVIDLQILRGQQRLSLRARL
ncbi:MAG: PDZ domain-containing protein [Rhodobacteraceae bacterium]|nr:PDZ domain-containing protein [Paracoccaceae bacterium]